MYRELLRDFKAGKPVPAGVQTSLNHRVNEDIRRLWRELPTGYFAGGFMRIIEPTALYKDVPEIFGELGHVPLMATGFGDVVAFDGHGTYLGYNFQRGIVSEVGVRLDYLLGDMQSGFFQREMFSPAGYREATFELEEPGLDQCFEYGADGYVARVVQLTDFVNASLALRKPKKD